MTVSGAPHDSSHDSLHGSLHMSLHGSLHMSLHGSLHDFVTSSQNFQGEDRRADMTASGAAPHEFVTSSVGER